MRDLRSALLLLGVLLIMAILHHLALAHFWYWTLWWFDVVLHILGGFAIGLLVLWGRAFFGGAWFYSTDARIGLLILGAVLIIGIGWELFEYTAGLFLAGQFFPDTIYDLLSGIAGGLLTYVYYYFLKHPVRTHHD